MPDETNDSPLFPDDLQPPSPQELSQEANSNNPPLVGGDGIGGPTDPSSPSAPGAPTGPGALIMTSINIEEEMRVRRDSV